ncbi:DUF3899 domain-containing protein [Radiobacillus kanasensis]|uniref:DUF3899 domain-containing protein n=1 Tax=Radiobacillus kanasensis TaxID=2844358 RepID=UPI001E60AABB|nr:DUF3899 domain-containing protein [Radiobacillus kanasensis]UFU00565.1 DUF3899 domain-containing protein [Radiobacillus kanasensis]
MNVGIAFILTIVSTDLSIIGFINGLFYVSLVYIMFSLILFIIRGKFLDGVTFGFRRFRSRVSKHDMDYLEELPLPSNRVNDTFYRLIYVQAVVLTGFDIVLLMIYYLVS